MDKLSIIITSLGVLIAFFGVLFVALAYLEWGKLKKLREDFECFKQDLQDDQYLREKANQRIFSSYSVADLDQRIVLLEEAVELHPKVFNGYNALGWAYIEKEEHHKAIDSFKSVIALHPKAKEGYFDLATAYLKIGESGLCIKTLAKAVDVDPSSSKDLQNNTLFKDVAEMPSYKKLIG